MLGATLTSWVNEGEEFIFVRFVGWLLLLLFSAFVFYTKSWKWQDRDMITTEHVLLLLILL